MDNDVLIVSYDKGYGNEIPILLVGRNTDKGMEIIKAFEREEANKVYELLSRWNKLLHKLKTQKQAAHHSPK